MGACPHTPSLIVMNEIVGKDDSGRRKIKERTHSQKRNGQHAMYELYSLTK